MWQGAPQIHNFTNVISGDGKSKMQFAVQFQKGQIWNEITVS